MDNKLKELRESFGLSQGELGRLVGVSRQAINSIENKKYDPSLMLAYKLSKLFKTPMEEIFDLEKEI